MYEYSFTYGKMLDPKPAVSLKSLTTVDANALFQLIINTLYILKHS